MQLSPCRAEAAFLRLLGLEAVLVSEWRGRQVAGGLQHRVAALKVVTHLEHPYFLSARHLRPFQLLAHQAVEEAGW